MKYGNIIDDHEIFGQNPEWVRNFLRHHKTGVDNLGRQYLGRCIQLNTTGWLFPSVLDIACGTAVNYETWKLMGIKHTYTGLDSTQALLDEAERRYKDEIKLAKGFAQDLPFQDEQFDIVIIRHLLEHLESYEQAIKEALRVARNELIIVFFLNPHDGLEHTIEERNSNIEGHPDLKHFWNTYSWSKFTQFVAGLGVQMKAEYVVTPGAAHMDTIVRLIK